MTCDPTFTGNVYRAKCDLLDYHLASDPALASIRREENESVSIIGIAKHLCGAGTDLGLRCLHNFTHGTQRQNSRSQSNDEDFDPIDGVGGIAIATCCHHRCVWQHSCFGSPDEWPFGPEDGKFVALTRITQWSNCRNNFKSTRSVRPGGLKVRKTPISSSNTCRLDLPIDELQRYGKIAKLLLDHQRAAWIRKHFSLECEVVQFADPVTTLENTLLLAYPKRLSILQN